MTNNTPSGAMKHHESAELDSHQMAKMFFFLSSTSDWLVQNCMTLSQWFLNNTAAVYTEQCTTPSLFHNFEVSRASSNCSLKNYISLHLWHHLHLYTCAQIT